jgi:broad specificity phosphatase PhoE
MSRLFFVRHAQASFMESNYDRLSPLGEQQAMLLGAYWARHQLIFDRVCTGPRVRQIDTCRIIADVYAKAGLPFPEPSMIAELDEYEGEAVLRRGVPELVAHRHQIRNLYEAYSETCEPAEKHLRFQRLYEAVITVWVNGELMLEGVEPWADFTARVNRGVSRFLSEGGSKERTAIFSSGGPTSLMVQRALDLQPLKTVQLSWMVRNSSFSEFVYSKDERFSLSAFNSIPHIEIESMRTYR